LTEIITVLCRYLFSPIVVSYAFLTLNAASIFAEVTTRCSSLLISVARPVTLTTRPQLLIKRLNAYVYRDADQTTCYEPVCLQSSLLPNTSPQN